MKKNGMGWFIADCVVGLVSGIAGIAGIYTSYKSANVQQDLSDLHLEEKYGLTPIDKEEE